MGYVRFPGKLWSSAVECLCTLCRLLYIDHERHQPSGSQRHSLHLGASGKLPLWASTVRSKQHGDGIQPKLREAYMMYMGLHGAAVAPDGLALTLFISAVLGWLSCMTCPSEKRWQSLRGPSGAVQTLKA